MTQWQAIDTAPKDGTWIAVMAREGGVDYQPSVACYRGGLWTEIHHYLDGDVNYDEWNVTHWMPLPAPPS